MPPTRRTLPTRPDIPNPTEATRRIGPLQPCPTNRTIHIQPEKNSTMVVKSTQPDPNFVKNEDVKDGFTLQPGQFLKLSHEMDPKMFVYYEVAVRFREKLYGGVPKDPNIVHAWIAKSTGFDDDLTKAAVIDTLKERGFEFFKRHFGSGYLA